MIEFYPQRPALFVSADYDSEAVKRSNDAGYEQYRQSYFMMLGTGRDLHEVFINASYVACCATIGTMRAYL
jgi:hypothetical protein